MRGRTAALLASLGWVGVVAALTVRDVVRNGYTHLNALSFLIVILLGIGVIGALTTPPPEE